MPVPFKTDKTIPLSVTLTFWLFMSLLKSFGNSEENLEKAEFLIPEVVDRMVKDGEVQMVVKSTPSKWYGITYKEDLEDFQKAIEELRENGEYPKHLY